MGLDASQHFPKNVSVILLSRLYGFTVRINLIKIILIAIDTVSENMHDTEVLFKFLQKRKEHCTQNLSIVNVIQIGGGRDNYCLTNAEDISRDKGYAVVSGWLSLPQKNQENNWQKQFTQHWWNYDQSQRKHFDFSPNIDDGAVYIQDDGIAKFVIDNATRLKSHVSSSVIVNNDEFFIIDYAENGFKYKQADDLSNDVIFFYQTA